MSVADVLAFLRFNFLHSQHSGDLMRGADSSENIVCRLLACDENNPAET